MESKDVTCRCNDFDEAMNEYLNYLDRWIVPKKRRVFLSDNIIEAKITNKEIDYFIKLFENGEDINGHLSRKIYDSDFYDKLLTHWDIHHLHLNTVSACTNLEMKKNRSSILLFFIIRNDAVYFIDVEKHNKNCVFSMFRLLKIIKENWPFLMQKIPIVSIPEENIITRDEDFKRLFDSNVNYFVSIDDDIYMMKFGSTLAGTSLENRLNINNLKNRLRTISKTIESDIKNIVVELLYPNKNQIMKISWTQDGTTKEVLL